jgi:hypothetical protein
LGGTLGSISNGQLNNSSITINGNATSLGGSVSVGTVTSVSGTAPVVSSGGTTPTISMAAANTSTNGYLTSTDWNTFNNKSPVLLTSGTVGGSPASGTFFDTGVYRDPSSGGVVGSGYCGSANGGTNGVIATAVPLYAGGAAGGYYGRLWGQIIWSSVDSSTLNTLYYFFWK